MEGPDPPAGFTVKFREARPDQHIIHVSVLEGPVGSCEQCGKTDAKRSGNYKQKVRDIPYDSKPVELIVNRRRYCCRNCGNTYSEILPSVSTKHSATDRLIEFIRSEMFVRTFAELSTEIGYTEGMLRSIFRDTQEDLEKAYRFETPEVMMVYEVTLLRKVRLALVNLYQSTLIDLIDRGGAAALEETLRERWKPGKIRAISIPMKGEYRRFTSTLIKPKKILVDSSYVTLLADRALLSVWINLRKTLNGYQIRKLAGIKELLFKNIDELNTDERRRLFAVVKEYSVLRQAYECWRNFNEIFTPNRSHKEISWEISRWRTRLNSELDNSFSPLTLATRIWMEEISNGANYPKWSRGMPHKIDNFIQSETSDIRGNSFDVIRTNLLYLRGGHVVRKSKNGREVNYGVSLTVAEKMGVAG